MHYIFKKFYNAINRINLTKEQLKIIADQVRLLSWALGAILTSTSGFNLKLNFKIMSLIAF